MKIGFIWHCCYPWDVRLEKLINAVVENGHTACIVSKGARGLPSLERNGPITIRRVQPWVVPAVVPAPRAVRAASNYPLFFNPRWIRETRAAVKDENLDILIVRDLPLALMVARIGRSLGTPVVFDMAENYPAALLSYQNKAYRPLLLKNAWLPRQYESQSVRQVDRVLVVAGEQCNRLIAAGVSPKKLMLVGNTPTESLLLAADQPDSYRPGQGQAGLNLLYVGFIDPHRGVDVAIRALPELLGEFPDLTLTIVGDGTARRGLMDLAQRLGIGARVSFPGWLSFDELPAYIRNSTVCLIPHLESEHTNTTLPNKLFEYMAFSKPVLASSCRPMKRIIDAEDCGVTFNSGSLEDFVASARKLIRDPCREQKGRNGKRAVERTYNWQVDKAAFLETIHHLVKGQNASSTQELSAICNHH